MDQGFIAAVSALSAAVTAISGVLWRIHKSETAEKLKAAYSLGRLEQRVDLLWEFLIKQGRTSALLGGVTTMTSPEQLASTAISLFNPALTEKLKRFYFEHGTLSDDDLFEEIHQRFGEELYNSVCVPNKLYYGACIIGAIKLVRG